MEDDGMVRKKLTIFISRHPYFLGFLVCLSRIEDLVNGPPVV